MPFDLTTPTRRLAQDILNMRDPLMTAAHYIAGTPGRRRAAAALEALIVHGPDSRFAINKLRELSQFLLLEADYDELPELSIVNPLDPRAEEVMLLADQFKELIDELAFVQTTEVN